MTAVAVEQACELTPIGDADPCIVETPPLTALVQAFIERWLTTRRSRKGQGDFGKNGPDPTYVEPIAAYARLEADTAAAGLRLDANVLRKVRKPEEYPYAELRVADAIVTVLGTPDMFHPDLCAGVSLTVMPNPLVRDESRWSECCGGSESAPKSVTAGMVVRFTAGELTQPSDSWLY